MKDRTKSAHFKAMIVPERWSYSKKFNVLALSESAVDVDLGLFKRMLTTGVARDRRL